MPRPAIGALVLAAALASAGAAWGQGANNPTYTIEKNGLAKGGGQVTCSGTSGVLFEGDGDRREWSAINTGGVAVHICCDPTFPLTAPTATPTPVACTTTTSTIYLAASGGARTETISPKNRCYCITASSTAVVLVSTSK